MEASGGERYVHCQCQRSAHLHKRKEGIIFYRTLMEVLRSSLCDHTNKEQCEDDDELIDSMS